MVTRSCALVEQLQTIPDPRRQCRNLKHRLVDVLLSGFCGVLAGCDNFVETGVAPTQSAGAAAPPHALRQAPVEEFAIEGGADFWLAASRYCRARAMSPAQRARGPQVARRPWFARSFHNPRLSPQMHGPSSPRPG